MSFFSQIKVCYQKSFIKNARKRSRCEEKGDCLEGEIRMQKIDDFDWDYLYAKAEE